MTATDELRRMLDERGVEWKAPASYDGSTKYDTIVDGYWFHEYDGKITVHGLTPEQAIDATLGRSECRFRTVERFIDAKRSRADMCECARCGYRCARGFIQDERFKFCPNCGRKVVSE